MSGQLPHCIQISYSSAAMHYDNIFITRETLGLAGSAGNFKYTHHSITVD